MVRAYQATLAPLLGGACKFHPSCSHYAVEALERHGAARGSWLALRRLLRCRPFAAGGYDPVPFARLRQAQGKPDELLTHRSAGWQGVTDRDERGQTGRSVLPESAQ